MWLGYSFLRINLSIGILFILIYISAIAVVLITTILLIGTGLTIINPRRFVPLVIAPWFFFLGDFDGMLLIYFPVSASSIGMSNIVIDLFVVNSSNVLAITFYYCLVGCILIKGFHKSLHLKTNSGIRGLTLNSNIELVSLH